jgi:ABC-type sugar transport system ATPase subunit
MAHRIAVMRHGRVVVEVDATAVKLADVIGEILGEEVVG